MVIPCCTVNTVSSGFDMTVADLSLGRYEMYQADQKDLSDDIAGANVGDFMSEMVERMAVAYWI